MARAKTNRKVPIYPRLQEPNAKWLAKMRTKYETTGADFVDRLVGYVRKNPNLLSKFE